VPASVRRAAEEHSIHVDLRSPRAKLVEAIELAQPGIRREHIHVWTLGGPSRATRLGPLWDEWRTLGAHLVEDGWLTPSGLPAFTESGTYAPIGLVGSWKDDSGAAHLFLCDGYAASAEAMQAASLAEAFDVDVSMAHYSPRFDLPVETEYHLMRLDPEAPGFEAAARRLLGPAKDASALVDYYRACLRDRIAANLPPGQRVLRASDFFPEKSWNVIAATGYIGDDPYSGLRGVRARGDGRWEVTTQLASARATVVVRFVFRFLESFEQQRLVFSPLLERFIAGEDYRNRAFKVSDSGRLRNELQTLCSQALEYTDERIRVHFDRINDDVIRPEHRQTIRKVLEWYKENHPVWFSWLELA